MLPYPWLKFWRLLKNPYWNIVCGCCFHMKSTYSVCNKLSVLLCGIINVTLFGKTRLNENSVEPFFHFNAFWKRSNALQIIFNAFENIDNVRERKRNALKIINMTVAVAKTICKLAWKKVSELQWDSNQWPLC